MDRLISEQEVLKVIENAIIFADWRDNKYDAFHKLEEDIKAIPSAESKTGHWIVEVWNNREHHTCSVCQKVVDHEPCYHYCPYCGAKMIEE